MAAASGASSRESKNWRASVTVSAQTSVIDLSVDAHGARLGAKARAAAIGARRVAAIAAQKDAHVQLVFLALEPGEEAVDAGEIGVRLALDDGVALLGGELPEGHVQGNAARAGETLQVLPKLAITGLGPRLDDAFVDGLAAIGNDQVEVEVDGIAEALAARAGAVRIVERKQARLGLLIDEAALLALEAIAEDDALGFRMRLRGRKFEDGFALAVAIADFHGVGQTRADFGGDDQAIDQHVDGLGEIDIEQSFRGREFVHPAGLVEAIESALLEIEQGLLDAGTCGRLCRRGRCGWRLSRRLLRWFREGQAKEHVKAAAGLECEHSGGDVVDGVATDFGAATGAESAAGAGVQQPQIIVNFGGGCHRGPRIARGVFLLDGNGRGDAGDFIDVRLFDALQELPRVGGERFDVSPLAFGVDGVESQAGFAGAGDAGDHGDGVVGNVEADVFEIVYTRARNDDGGGLVDDRCCGRCGGGHGDFGLIWLISQGHLRRAFTGACSARVLYSRDFGVNPNEKLYVAGRGAANEAARAEGSGAGGKRWK